MPFEIVFTVADDVGKKATTSVKIPTTFLLADYVEFGAGMATALNNFLRGKILSADLCLDVDISSLTGNVTSGISDVEEIGAFEFVTAAGNRVKLNIPGMAELDTITGTNVLDETEAEVAAVITMMEDGIAGALPCDVGGDDIVDTLFAREHFRSSGRRR